MKVEKLRSELSAASSDTQKVRLLNLISYELRKTDTAGTRKHAQEALRLAIRESYYEGQAQAYLNLGEYFRVRDASDEALESYFESISICVDHNLKKDLSKVYNKVGVVYQNLGDYEQALLYFNKSLPLSKELGDDETMAGLYNNIGVINYLLGKYTNAQENFLASLKIRERLDDKSGIAASYNNIANIFNEQRKYDQALAYYLKGVDIRKEINDLKGLCSSYGNIGSLYYLMGNNKNAMLFYEEASEISEKLKDKATSALSYINIGKINLDEGNHAEAVKYFSTARRFYQELGDKRGLATTEASIGSLYLKRKNFQLALAHLNEALKIAREIRLKDEVQSIYYKLAQVCEAMADYKRSSEYYRLSSQMQDSLAMEEATQMVSELEAKYRMSKKQKEIELLKKQKEIQAAVLDKNQLTLYSSFALIALVLVIAFIIYRNNLNKQKANAILIEQNKKILLQKEEKEVLLKEVHHRVKNNLQVINSLLNIQSAYIDDERITSMFIDCQNRVRSMALIHEQLYSSANLHKVDLGAYIESLTRDILRSYNLNYKVSLDIKLSVESFGVNTLIPVGLIINELFSNSLKHAFDDGVENGKFFIKLDPVENGYFEFVIGDNGKGMKDDYWNTENSLGMELIQTFVKQLDGTIEKLPVPGTVFRIRFKDISPSHEARVQAAGIPVYNPKKEKISS